MGERQQTLSLQGSRTRSFPPLFLTVAREARGSDSLPQLVGQTFCGEQSTRAKPSWVKVTAH